MENKTANRAKTSNKRYTKSKIAVLTARLYRVYQKFVPLLYKSVIQYDWTSSKSFKKKFCLLI